MSDAVSEFQMEEVESDFVEADEVPSGPVVAEGGLAR
jgi:hypothetical protein